MIIKGESRVGINKVFGINRYTLLYIKQVTNKDLLYSIGNYIQCLVITYNGKESEKEYRIYAHTHIYIYIDMLQPRVPGNKLTQKDNADSAVQFILWQAQGRGSSQPRTPTSFCENLIYPKCMCTTHLPKFPDNQS